MVRMLRFLFLNMFLILRMKEEELFTYDEVMSMLYDSQNLGDLFTLHLEQEKLCLENSQLYLENILLKETIKKLKSEIRNVLRGS